jgi:predicted small lipoprotein YifL
MITKHVTFSILAMTALVSLAACGTRASNQAGPAAGQPAAVAQARPTQNPEQPAIGSTVSEAGSPTPAAESQTAEPTSPTESQPEQPTEVPTTPPEQPATAPTEIAIPPAGETADALRQEWSQAYALPAGVPFAVTLTEAQVEALIAEAMAKSSYGSKVSSIDVTLNNGQIGVAFTTTISQKVGPRTVDVSGTATVIFNASIDANGKLVLGVASATLTATTGQQISIPPEMLTVLNTTVSQALTGASSSAESEVTLTELTISGGTMTIKGYVTP